MKKRFSALFLALALCLGLAVPAFAADENTSPEITCQRPENSGILMESKTETYSVVGFVRGTNENGAPMVAYMDSKTIEDASTMLLPTGVDIIVTGAKSEDEVVFTAWTDNRQQLFLLAPEKDAYLVPIPKDELSYTLPADGKTEATGNPTAAQLGFSAAQDGTITCNSDRLYELFETNTLLRITVGESFWLFQLSGEPKLISDVFTDVPVGNWVTDPVVWAVQNNITNGTEKDKFSPGKDCTNAQILTFIWRAYGEPEPTVENPFTNSIPDGYAKAAVWASEKGMVSGTTFDVDKPCTRAMAMTYLWQAAGSPETEPTGKFTDVAASDPYAQAVAWAVANGITKGATDTTFAPENICQRGQIVVFLYNAVADKT